MAIDLLLIEDNPGDVRLTEEAFRRVNESVRLHVATDGVEAMSFLRREGIYARVPRPVLILLDLNLPKLDGREVLSLIKADEQLKTIPVLVLTLSDAPADVTNSYQAQANCYLKKPLSLEEFQDLILSLDRFWLTNVKLMRHPRTEADGPGRTPRGASQAPREA
jgi:chemotaxis family two-component system response regulator Rcp1